MKRHWTAIALALGPAILISTIVWEVARVVPSYRFLVNPWSIKAYETTHGWAFMWLGVALFVGAMLVLWEGSTEGIARIGVLAYFVVAGTAITAVLAPGTTTISIGIILGIGLALFLALIVFRFSRSTIVKAVPILGKGWVQGVLFLAFWSVTLIVLSVTLVDRRVTVSTAVGVFALLALLAIYASAAEPRGLAGNRMLIYCSILTTLVVVTSGGALRSTLLRLQRELDGLAAEYREVQVGVGWFLAVLGTLLLFTGAVGLWAKRQDLLVAITRARRQREAAEKSAAEIRAAEEAYLAESRTGSSVVGSE